MDNDDVDDGVGSGWKRMSSDVHLTEPNEKMMNG